MGAIGKKISTLCLEWVQRLLSLKASCIGKDDNFIVEAAGASDVGVQVV